MYIIPDSTLYILRNVPLDTTYDHTLWFNKADAQDIDEGKRAQAAYFSSLAKYRLEYERGNALTYIRVNRGTIKVPYKADDLYDCNYIMFRNRSFGTKWFYAFIRSIEYVNNTTTEITFELDVMQTWHFDYQIDECFVEREHSVNDIVGENTLPEDVAIGDYVSDSIQQLTDEAGTAIFRDWVIVLAQTSETQAVPIPAAGGWYGNNTYQQVKYTIFPSTTEGANNLRDALDTMSIFNNTDVVARIFMFPRALIPEATAVTPISGNKRFSRPSTFGSFTPKNNKLLTFPYTCLTITDLQGKVIDYHWEYFSNPISAEFGWMVSFGVKPSVVFYPIGYLQNLRSDDGSRYEYPAMEYRITMDSFPDVPYATTDLMAKIVQGGMGLAINTLSGGAVSTTSTVEKFTKNTTKRNKAGEITGKTRTTSTRRVTTEHEGGKEPISSQISNTFMDSVFDGRVTASIGDQQAMANLGWCTFVIMKNRIREEYARVIDDYFSAFGYATKRLKHPNCSSRPHWNYVKTIGCTITGSVPCDDMAAICSIYDNGITFWKNGAEVGNYSLDNSPS